MPRNRAVQPKVIWKGKWRDDYYGKPECPVVGVTHTGSFKSGRLISEEVHVEPRKLMGSVKPWETHIGHFPQWGKEEFKTKLQAKTHAEISLTVKHHKEAAFEEMTPDPAWRYALKSEVANQPPKDDARFFEERDVQRIWQSGWESHELEKYNGMGAIDVHYSEERVAIGKSAGGYHIKSEGMTDGRINSTDWGLPMASENDAKNAAKDKLAGTLELQDPGVYGLTIDPFGIPPHEAKTMGYEKAERAFRDGSYLRAGRALEPQPLVSKAQGETGPQPAKAIGRSMFLRSGNRSKKNAKPQKRRSGPHR